MQLGRFDELGSGILNINKYYKVYSGQGEPLFLEGAVFKTVIPLEDSLLDTLNAGDRINETLSDRINDVVTGRNSDVSDAGDRINDTLSDRIYQVRRLNDRINDTLKSKLTGKVNDTVLLILMELTTVVYWNPLLNDEELANKIHVSVATINRYLKVLRTENITELKGSRKKGGFTTTQAFQLVIEK